MKCIVCGARGKRIQLVGKAAVGGCGKHEKALSMGLAITGAAAKAGVIAGLQATRPGLYEDLGRMYFTMRDVFSGGKRPADG